MASSTRLPLPVVYGVAGPRLGRDEHRLFADSQPVGFILFRRNIESADQVRRLVADLKDAAGHPDTLVLIDQEGGRVQRLGPPTWQSRPSMQQFGERARAFPRAAREIVRLNAFLIAAELFCLGINVNCAPVLDLFHPDGHGIVGDRAFSADPEVVSLLGRAMCDGLLDGGVMPVVKHLPGHGRAGSDSHVETPCVETSRDELERSDFVPFSALRDAPAGMTAHVIYSDIDPDRPASVSRRVINTIIRSEIGFDGLLLSDDVCMAALTGAATLRVREVLQAGCDIALHCNGNFEDMARIAETCPEMNSESARRLERARSCLIHQPGSFDVAKLQRRVTEFLEEGRGVRS